MQIQEQIRHVIPAAQFLQLIVAVAGTHIARRAFIFQLWLKLIGKVKAGIHLLLQQALRRDLLGFHFRFWVDDGVLR
ncbi:hypothetical protein D3C80_1558190 [compost metagenome]